MSGMGYEGKSISHKQYHDVAFEVLKNMSTMNYYVSNSYLRNFDNFGWNMKILWLFENVSIRHSKTQGRKNAQKNACTAATIR